MPSKWIRHYDAGIRIEVAGVPVAEQLDAIKRLVPSDAEFEARHLELNYYGAESRINGKRIMTKAYGLVTQSRSGDFSRMEPPGKAFWDDSIWFTDREWLESFGLVVTRNTHLVAHCHTCWAIVDLDAVECFKCGRFTHEESYGSKCGLPVRRHHESMATIGG